MDSSKPLTIPTLPPHSAQRRQWLCLSGWAAALAIGCGWPHAARAGADESVLELQRDWEIIKYRTSTEERISRFESLAAKAHRTTDQFPGHCAALVWEAVIVSSWAEAKDDLGSLDLAKRAKVLYETALKIDATALGGGAYTGLAALHYKLPGWPLSFGDQGKARELLQRALAINPQGVDPNYYYGELLVETMRLQEAVVYLERALQAPARPGREIGDAGRRDEARALLDKIKAR